MTEHVSPEIREAVRFYLDNSEIGSNGVRKVTKGTFMERLSTHGVDEKTLKSVQSAVDFETTVAAHVALHDVEEQVKGATKAQLKDDEFRRGLSATVRLPTLGGSTEVTVHAESIANIPARPDADGNSGERGTKTTWGRTRTTINTKGRIDKTFHDYARDSLRKSLGITD